MGVPGHHFFLGGREDLGLLRTSDLELVKRRLAFVLGGLELHGDRFLIFFKLGYPRSLLLQRRSLLLHPGLESLDVLEHIVVLADD